MDGWIDGWMDGWMDGRMDRLMDEQMDQGLTEDGQWLAGEWILMMDIEVRMHLENGLRMGGR